MTIKERIEADLKRALLAGDKDQVLILRTLKSSILYAEVEQNKRDTGLGETEVISVLQKEAKKRAESAELFNQGGNQEKAEQEQKEFEIIKQYLPEMMSEEQLTKIVEQVIGEQADKSAANMGPIIGLVRAKTNGQAEGGLIARIVKEQLNKGE